MAKELFERIDRKVSSLIEEVLDGKIGLPDLQRPFVWADTKVKELLDSMMKGFPIGYVMLWASPSDYENAKTIGDLQSPHEGVLRVAHGERQQHATDQRHFHGLSGR